MKEDVKLISFLVLILHGLSVWWWISAWNTFKTKNVKLNLKFTASISNANSNHTDVLLVVWLRVLLILECDIVMYLEDVFLIVKCSFKRGWLGIQLIPAAWSHWTDTAASLWFLHRTVLIYRYVSTRFPPSTLLRILCETLHTSAYLCYPPALCTWFLVHISRTWHREWISGPRNSSVAVHCHSSERLWVQVPL